MIERGFSYWAIIIVMACFAAALIVAFWPQSDLVTDSLSPRYIQLWSKVRNRATDISEKARIEKWIVDNKLNQYGESADTLYAGGTPLFDELTGKTLDRYEYIFKNHPDRPWNN